MDSPLAHVVDGYNRLAASLLERWSAHASMVATKLDAGGYDADDAAADLAATASLATESGFLLASEALDAAAILTGRQDEPHIVDSEVFSTSLAGAKLRLAGPLVSGHGSALPAAVVSVKPPELEPTEADFSLRADATGHRAGTYVGSVVASRGDAVESVTVLIVVP